MKNSRCNNSRQDEVLYTISDVFRKYAVEDSANVEELAQKVHNYFCAHNIKKNFAGGDITYVKVLSEIKNNIVRRIKYRVGERKKSWWSSYDIIENEKCFKIVKRSINNQPLMVKI